LPIETNKTARISSFYRHSISLTCDNNISKPSLKNSKTYKYTSHAHIRVYVHLFRKFVINSSYALPSLKIRYPRLPLLTAVPSVDNMDGKKVRRREESVISDRHSSALAPNNHAGGQLAAAFGVCGLNFEMYCRSNCRWRL